VHYCSVENKHTGQIYQQNFRQPVAATYWFSPADYFLKTAKVFGTDIRKARRALRANHSDRYRLDGAHNCLELHVDQIGALKGLNIEVGLSYNVMEMREAGRCLRELKIALAHPENFDLDQDA
jgi:hypothetical protein